MLPKGRKDLSEDLEQTATRETFEETGVRVDLLPVSIETMATSPLSLIRDRPKAVTEPIAVSQRMTQGGLKIIFWYVAMADSTASRQEGTQQENEEFDTVWASFKDADEKLSFADDRRITQEAIGAVQRGLVET